MRTIIWNFINRHVGFFDVILLPFAYLAASLLKSIRSLNFMNSKEKFHLCNQMLFKVGVFPIIKHYYEPAFDNASLKRSLYDDRFLPGINWNVKEQLEILEQFRFIDELKEIPCDFQNNSDFYVNNPNFTAGDCDYWYNIIRLKKPSRIIEIGSGYSTKMAFKAILKNQQENPAYQCDHICIEPYEASWLEESGVTVIRKKVEELEINFFSELNENDILFIDSSHIIRPQGDVLFEYLSLLPSLKKGVIVHIHDIFSPKDYPAAWVVDQVRLWNEQYLVEAFLTSNRDWKIIGALNFLTHNYFDEMQSKCSFLKPACYEPGSLYIQKVS